MNQLFFKHNKLFLALACVVTILVLWISAANTFSIVTRYFELTDEVAKNHIARPTRKKVDVEAWANVDINKVTFDAVSRATSQFNVLIEQMESAHTVSEGEFETATRRVQVQGKYTDVLQCVSAMQADLQHIKIVSLKFSKEKRGKTEALLADIYFQTMKPL